MPARHSGEESAMQTRVDENFNNNERVVGILERLRDEPSLQGWVLMAPTRALATLGVSLDDGELGTTARVDRSDGPAANTCNRP